MRRVHVHLHDAPEAMRSTLELKRLHDLDFVLESPKGSWRRGVGWQVRMPADYGYIQHTRGADDEGVDAYVGPDPSSEDVYIIDQLKLSTQRFDEHKCMVGYSSALRALEDYVNGFSDGRGVDRIGKVTPVKMSAFKAWLTTRPAQDAEPHWSQVGTPTVSPSQVARAAKAKLGDKVRKIEMVRGRGYYYVAGELANGRFFTFSMANMHLKSQTVENWVGDIVHGVEKEIRGY